MGSHENSRLNTNIKLTKQVITEKENKKEYNENEKKYVNKLFNSKNLSYKHSEIKIQTYLLNIEHIKGGSKANFLINYLGYSKDNPKELFKNIKIAIDNLIPNEIEDNGFGVKLTFITKLKSINPKYNYGDVVIAIIEVKNSNLFRIVTTYPNN